MGGYAIDSFHGEDAVLIFIGLTDSKQGCKFAFNFHFPMSRNCFNIISAVFFVVIATNPATAQYVNRLESAGFNTDKTSIYIEDLKTGEVVLDLNGELPLMPASVMKIVTAASVLSSGDSSARFRTRVTTNGTIENGILKDDIILYASGDPTVESAFFPSTAGITDSIAEKIVSMGVNMINGDVIISYPSWMEEPVPAGWKDTDLIRPYGTGYHAFNYADNRMAIKFPSLKTNPPVPDGTVKFIRTQKGFSINRNRTTNAIKASGRVLKRGRTEITSNPNPQASFSLKLKETLNDRGVKISGIKSNNAEGDETELYINESPEIVDILRSMMHRSDNLYAEAMLNTLAPGGREKALDVEREIWANRGADIKDISIKDGSGLSRDNRLTAYFLADVLSWMAANHNENNVFVNLFPLAGQEGTVKRFLSDTDLEGALVLKSGSVNDVQCYAGYRLDEMQNPSHLIVIMSNDFGCSRAALKKYLQKLLIEKL